MKNLESNKIVASILLSGLIAMLCSFFADIFYKGDHEVEKRGYQIVIDANSATTMSEESEVAQEIVIADVMKLADYEKGKSLMKKCAACHSFEKDGPNKVGPNLWNILGHDKASKVGYAYSEVLTTLAGNWNYEDMYHFLNSPRKFSPGTKMTFPGFKKPEEIASVIEFLRNNSDKPIPLPN